jgi:hypothetical protein
MSQLLPRLNPRRLILAALLLALLIVPPLSGAVVGAQGIADLIAVSVSAGYDGYFREEHWLPLRVVVENNGDDLTGQLTVRPETSGRSVANSFSTPVSIPSGTTQSVFLYIVAESGSAPIRVELLNDTGGQIDVTEARLRSVPGFDRLYAAISGATSGSVLDLSEVATGGRNAVQARWTLADIPDRSAALDAIDALLINDIDTGALSSAQVRALTQWVTAGGHLIVTGGVGWQPTAAGLRDLLPLRPSSSATIDEAAPIVIGLGADTEYEAEGDFIVATGDLSEDARLLAATADGLPLAARRELGEGTIDYLAFDPNSEPFRSWNRLDSLWLTLLGSTDSRPSWSFGFSDWDAASSSVEILPGFNPLPAAFGLVAFLLAYVALVGPVNYLVLNRLNRREWAWLTIPLLIVIFSVMARAVGFNLRGNEATLSRLTVVRAWADSETAEVDQVIGLLAPRRNTYSLAVEDTRLLRPLPVVDECQQSGAGGARAAVDVVQGVNFEAVDFPVEDGCFTSFTLTGTIPSPDIGGRVTLTYRGGLEPALQGAVRNDSELTLTDAVLLANGQVWYLDAPLEPGTVLTFDQDDFILSGLRVSPPSPLEYVISAADPYNYLSSFRRSSSFTYAQEARRTAIDIMSPLHYVDRQLPIGVVALDQSGIQTDLQRRQQAFLDSFIIDQYGSTGRGNKVYLAGWTDAAPLDEALRGSASRGLDTTLYLIELDTEVNSPQTVTIPSSQFSWLTVLRSGQADVGPYDIFLSSQAEAVFRFTPLPEAVLAEVETLAVIIEQPGRAGAGFLLVDVWNWETAEWETLDLEDADRVEFDDPQPYLGPQNAVQVRIQRPEIGGIVEIRQIAVEQTGSF